MHARPATPRALPPPHGSLVALATPFRSGVIDMTALADLTDRQIRRGTTSLVVCGSTGEAAALDTAEQARALAIVLEAANRRVPVIAGCAAPATEAATHLAAAAARAGASALLVAPPPYSRPTQDGIVAHLRAVALASDLPIIVYDVPGRTGVAIADNTVARLFDCGLIAAIKDATADLARPPRLRALCGEGLVQLTGDDATTAAYRAMGGQGCISVTANLVPALCARLHAAWDEADLPTVARIRDTLAPLHETLFLESNPIPLKAALAVLRLSTGDLRLPLTRASTATRDRLASILGTIAAAEETEAAALHAKPRKAKLASVPASR